ncbi:hypothetical protein [Methylobacterium oryzisoli]|uniref:hypothetical protein n=1 Tax=Methylobacterium oryzisoli TaxID=3385502 RepID=UPI0038912D71
MIVYGDVRRRVETAETIDRMVLACAQAAGLPPGIGRHGALAAAFITAGELAQGLGDAAFAVREADAPSPAEDAALALLMTLGRALRHSWDTGFSETSLHTSDVPGRAASLAALALPRDLVLNRAEGFAFYAHYPESVAAAARASGLGAGTRVIGIRSIGAPLGAMAAAALGAAPPVTVRPVGHPFRRQLSLSPARAAALDAPPGTAFAVVDEGPGLSGSSFGAVADHLEARGVAPERITFFPSHPGAPGPQASAAHRARWAAARRCVVTFDDLVLRAPRPEHRLETWLADLLGPLDGPPEDVSGGAWRARHWPSATAWPPVDAQQERRKFVVRAGGRPWLAKFVGLGAEGEAKLVRAQRLAAAGLTPPVAGFRHGFLVERWMEEARPLAPGDLDPLHLAEQVGRYLALRAEAFPTGPDRGASLPDLVGMARHNAWTALGTEAAGWFDRWRPNTLVRLAARLRPVETDNRLQPWEWLLLPDGALLKADALDHHAAHDLVGCQDVAWDVVGAGIELVLPSAARDRLAAIVARGTGRAIDPDLLALLAPCYLAFRIGACTMAAAAASPEEAGRLARAADAYAERLRAVLGKEPDDGDAMRETR